MPWKLILFLICLVLTVFFIGFNLENACNINLGYKTFENVPVFLTVLVSFGIGALVSFMFMLGVAFRKTDKKVAVVKEPKRKIEKEKKVSISKDSSVVTPPLESTIAPEKKVSFFEKGKSLLPKNVDKKKLTKKQLQSMGNKQ